MLYSLQKGFRTGQPELLTVGNHVWIREFNTYYVRAQDRYADNNNPMSNYIVHGRIYDEYCEGHSVTCSYAGGRPAQSMGSLAMTPSIFNPKPVAIASVNPPETREGCAGGNNGRVTFDHSGHFIQTPKAALCCIDVMWIRATVCGGTVTSTQTFRPNSIRREFRRNVRIHVPATRQLYGDVANR